MARRLGRFAGLLPLLLTTTALNADWQRGVAAYKQGDWATAVSELTEVTESHPDFANGYWLLGHALARLERWEEAAANYQRALDLEGDTEPEQLLAVARVQLQLGRTEAALSTLVDLSPDQLSEPARSAFATVLAGAAARSSSPELAVARLERAVREMPEEAILWQALGGAYERSGRSPDAVEAYVRALGQRPEDSLVAELLIRATFRAARDAQEPDVRAALYRQGAEVAEKLAAADGSEEHWLLLGEGRLGAREYPQALAAFEKAAGRAPRDPLPDYYRGRAHLGLGDAAAALQALQGGLRKHPDEALERRFHLALGEAYHSRHDYHDAAQAYRRAGDEAKARLMEEYQEIAGLNDQIERDLQRCRERLSRLEALAEETRDLEGTAEWRGLQREIETLRGRCGPPAQG